MERLPLELCHKILCFLDHQNLATAQQVCRKWKLLASENNLWENLFKERWGQESASFYAPTESKSWKDVYEVQDRCDRAGLGLSIVREGEDYYIIYLGQIQRHLGTRRKGHDVYPDDFNSKNGVKEHSRSEQEVPSYSILDKILFFIGDLEAASFEAKRRRLV